MSEAIKQMSLKDYSLLFFKDERGEYVELWDIDSHIFTLNFHPNREQIKEIMKIYELGIERGNRIGKEELKLKFRNLFNLADEEVNERINRLEDRSL
jgi:hypothetical protein